jgi:hypothetical protein
VLQAQRTLDSLMMVREAGPDTAYDKDSKAYIGQVDKWKKDIEVAEVEQALVAALLLAVPDSLVYDDVDGWKAQIDALVEDSATVEYNKYQTKMEMANYYTNYIHDGVKAFNDAAEAWKAENPAVDNPGSEPKKTDAKYKDHSDTIKVMMKKGDVQDRSWDKFVYLLGSYKDVVYPASKKSPKNTIFTFSTTGDTVTVIANQALKEYVMGAAGNGKKSQKAPAVYDSLKTADYGLEGVYDILSRELVISEEEAATPEAIEEAKKAAAEKDSIWAAHRQILIDGVAAYVPFNEAEAVLEYEEEENGEGAKKMVEAVKAIKTAFSNVEGVAQNVNFDYYDSTEIFKAIIAFAKAREEYLDYSAPKEIDPQDAVKRDSTVFYYSEGKSGADKPIIASKKFSELTFEELRAGKYEYFLDDDPGNQGDYKKWTPGTVVNAFANILSQLMGEDFVTAITADPIVAVADNNMSKALYNTYTVKTWADPQTIQKGGSDYVPEDLQAAKDTVVAKINEFIGVYNSFWFVNIAKVDPAGTNDVDVAAKEYLEEMDKIDDPDNKIAEKREKLVEEVNKLFSTAYPKNDPKRYTKATFKPYENEAPIVTLTSGSVDQTDAVSAVLVSVDPNTPADAPQDYWTTNDINANSAILKNNGATGTDFYNYIAAYNAYYKLVDQKATTDLADIRKQINAVITAFSDDAAREGKFLEDKYNSDHDTWETNKPLYDAYVAALKEFTGTDSKGKANGVQKFSAPTTAPADFTSVAEVLMGNAVEPKNAYGTYPGTWQKKLGGKQLELANELFPEYPESIKAWDEQIEDDNDQITHDRILINAAKDAYFASATIADELVKDKDGNKPANWDELVKNYEEANKRYRARLIGIIEELQEEIEANEECIAKFNQGLPQLDIAIAKAERVLRVETARLDGYKEALAYAKANLDRILEYVKSLDANFVIPEAPKTSTATI